MRRNTKYPPEDDIQMLQREQNTHPVGDTTMEEQYTLEEWLGMLEEAGYSLNERSAQAILNKQAKNRQIASTDPLGDIRFARRSAQRDTPDVDTIKTTVGQGGSSMARAKRAAIRRPGVSDEFIKTITSIKESESYTLEEWLGMLEEAGYDTNDMDEGKLSRLAAGLGLAGAAMMGGAKDAGAQQVASAPTAAASSDSVAQGTALSPSKARFDAMQALRARGISPSPQSNKGFGNISAPVFDPATNKYTVTADYRADRPASTGGAPQMEERYSLEEWLGMLEEAGYSLEEGSVEDETSALKAALSAKGSETTLGKGMADIKAALKRLQAARKAGKAAKANESYTLEEWMGMMEEAGVVEEGWRNALAGLALAGGLVGADRLHNPPQPHATDSAPRPAAVDARDVAGNLYRIDSMKRAAAERARARQAADSALRAQSDSIAAKAAATMARTAPGGVNERDMTNEERYTLEEWMGMLEEAGYDVSEYSLWRPKESGAKSTGVMKDPKKPKTPPAEPTKPKKKLTELSPEEIKAQKNSPEARDGFGPKDRPSQKEKINENTVLRLQSLAGIKPTE